MHATERVCLRVMPDLAPSIFLADLSSSNTANQQRNMKHLTQWYVTEKSPATTTTLPCYLLNISGILNCQNSKRAIKPYRGHHKDQEKIQAQSFAIWRWLVQCRGR